MSHQSPTSVRLYPSICLQKNTKFEVQAAWPSRGPTLPANSHPSSDRFGSPGRQPPARVQPSIDEDNLRKSEQPSFIFRPNAVLIGSCWVEIEDEKALVSVQRQDFLS